MQLSLHQCFMCDWDLGAIAPDEGQQLQLP